MKKQKKFPGVLAFFLLLVFSVMPASAQASGLEGWGQALLNQLPYGNGQKNTAALAGKVIVVDPGHGGSDTGAIGPNRVQEKEVTLNIAKELKHLLSSSGATVIMTRNSDKDVNHPEASDAEELQARVDIANGTDADIFVSIHADAYAGYAGGTTTYFYYGSDDQLARSVQQGMVDQLKLTDRGAQPNDYYLLQHTRMPAVLTEVAYISNPKEEKLLNNRTFNKKAALGIYNGIKNYFLQ